MADNNATVPASSVSWESGESDNMKQDLVKEMNQEDPAGGKSTPPPEVNWEGEESKKEPAPEGGPKGDEKNKDKGDSGGQVDQGDKNSEEGEDSMFYNPEEMYPDEEIHPNQYKTKFDAAQGVVNKARMLYDNYSEMKEAGVDPNAMDLPDYLDGDIENLKKYFDVAQVADMDDEKVVSVIYQSDKFIPEVKELAKTQKSEYETTKQINELASELNQEKDPLIQSINQRFGISLSDKSIDTNEKLLAKMDDVISDAEEDEKQDLQSIKNQFIDFSKKLSRYDSLVEKKEKGDTQKGWTEEDAKSAFRQFVQLNPNSDVNKFPEVRQSFGAWIEIHGSNFDLGRASGWKQAEREYMKVIDDLKKKHNAKQAKQQVEKKKPERQQPPAQEWGSNKTDPYREQMNSLKAEKEALKREMNLGK